MDLWKIVPIVIYHFIRTKRKIVVTITDVMQRQKYPTINRVPFSACHNINCRRGCVIVKLGIE
jgi:hypothetical protein